MCAQSEKNCQIKQYIGISWIAVPSIQQSAHTISYLSSGEQVHTHAHTHRAHTEYAHTHRALSSKEYVFSITLWDCEVQTDWLFWQVSSPLCRHQADTYCCGGCVSVSLCIYVFVRVCWLSCGDTIDLSHRNPKGDERQTWGMRVKNTSSHSRSIKTCTVYIQRQRHSKAS